jgi:hypothetical protein
MQAIQEQVVVAEGLRREFVLPRGRVLGGAVRDRGPSAWLFFPDQGAAQ